MKCGNGFCQVYYLLLSEWFGDERHLVKNKLRHCLRYSKSQKIHGHTLTGVGSSEDRYDKTSERDGQIHPDRSWHATSILGSLHDNAELTRLLLLRMLYYC